MTCRSLFLLLAGKCPAACCECSPAIRNTPQLAAAKIYYLRQEEVTRIAVKIFFTRLKAEVFLSRYKLNKIIVRINVFRASAGKHR